ncbi:MAG: pantoate--beta-alanine ligase [Vicinamibacterales bacterium]
MTRSLARCSTIASLRESISTRRGSGLVGFVPTMGALHDGHGRLIEEARRECATVVVSIFVNPLQFDREDDLRRYPRTLERDLELCAARGADVVFSPDPAEMYPRPPVCTVRVGALADHLCGRHRPGHFDGVATVVLKLFQVVGADRAYFGEKDRQQLTIIRRLVEDCNVPIAIVGVPTVRESDGLALSSRNQHLDTSERALAPALYRALLESDRLIAAGAADAESVLRAARRLVPTDPSVRLEYLEVVDPDDLRPVTTIEGPVVVAGAMWVGSTRLIDNVLSAPGRSRPSGVS